MKVSRDPFSRTEIHRKVTPIWCGTETCSWCDGVRVTKSGRRYLYVYRVESDGGRSVSIRGAFCSKSCMESFSN